MYINGIKSYKSTCSYCGVGCGVVVEKDRSGKIHVKGDEEYPVNKGMLCSKGMSLHYTVMDKSDRILYPQMRWNRQSELKRVSWDSALNRAAAVFKSFIKQHGPDSVGFYVSGQCLTEEYYLINKLTKGYLGTNNIDTNSRLCMSSAVVGYKMALGEDSVPVSYADIELADCFFITGANPAWCHPILFRRLEAHKQKNPDTKVVVVDPRKTQTCYLADLHLQIKPGTDITAYHAIGRVIIENNWTDSLFIDANTDGYPEYKAKVMERTVEEAAEICGVSADDIRLAAKYIGEATGMISMWAMGLNQSSIGVNKNLALLNLSLITGQIGKPGAGPFSLTGQPNAMGGREVGGLSNMLPAHRDLANPQHRQEVADFWGVASVPEKPGLTATQMFESLKSGKMKAIWIVCTNPSVSLPDARLVDEALKEAKFVIVQDISNNSDTTKYADLVLPAAGYMEKEGTMTNSERRISYLPKIIDAPGQARPDSDIIIDFAKRMGFSGFDFKSAEDVYLEHAQLTKGTNCDVSGLNYKILKKKDSVQWPYPSGETNGTHRLFVDKQFFTNNKKAKIHTVESDLNLSEPTTDEYPLVLTTGRIRDQWHTMTRTGKVNKLKQHISNAFLEIHPKDAKEKGITDGTVVEIYNERGNVRVAAKVTEDIREGVVFLPMHWGKVLNRDLNRANNLTNTLLDPKSKQPDFKFSAVNVKPYKKPKQKVVVVGAGAAAFRFLTAYRELNTEDEIHIFSKEEHPFYNRVMLPDYISGVQNWEKLLKANLVDGVDNSYHLHRATYITEIDRDNKIVTDQNGLKYEYDKLIIATGSSSFRPGDIPPNMEGVFTLRTRHDADKIKQNAENKKKVVVVGGGLLGIELADALNTIGIEVTILQRSSRLMERQLDETASNLLDSELRDRNIQILYNDEVKSFVGDKNIEALRLKSGRVLECGTVVFAIGTRPNTQISRAAGIKHNRGVVVNDYMQTSDPSIFALGEIAEHRKNIYGITAAAEEQAEIAAKYINGDFSAIYTGSLPMNILKVEGLRLCSMGVFEMPSADEEGYEEITLIDKTNRYYKKCIVHKDKLIGCLLMGDNTETNKFRELIKDQVELGDKRKDLLRSAGSEVKIKGKLICSCNTVGEGNIRDEIAKGCNDLSNLCKTTGAGTGCGSCKPEVKAILDSSQSLIKTAEPANA